MKRDVVAVWLRLAASTAVAAVTLFAVDPPRPDARLASPLAIAVGATGGVGLFAAVFRRWASPLRGTPTAPATLAFLALFALSEEVIWRRLVLGEALRGGAIVAVAASTVAFALMHRV